MKKIILFFLLVFSGFLYSPYSYSNDSFVDWNGIDIKTANITDASISAPTDSSFSKNITNKGLSFLYAIKIVISGGLLIYLVYSGVMMVISMGRDESRLSDAKRSIWYCILAMFFINIPATLYSTFYTVGNVGTVG